MERPKEIDFRLHGVFQVHAFIEAIKSAFDQEHARAERLETDIIFVRESHEAKHAIFQKAYDDFVVESANKLLELKAEIQRLRGEVPNGK